MSLREIIFLTWGYYNRGTTLQDEVLAMYCEDLADLDLRAVAAAYAQYRRNPANRTFPLPAQIRELVCPDEFISPEIKARETAARIVGAISQYGWNNAREAQLYIGPEGWQAVLRQGGWSHLCEQTSKYNELTLQAQMRDQLIGTYRHGAPAIAQSIGAPAKRSGELVQANFAKLLGERPDEPEEGA